MFIDEEDEMSGVPYHTALLALKVGDTVGIKTGTGVRKKIYRLEKVERITKAQIILANKDRFWRERGSAVGGLSWIQIMTPSDIKQWHAEKQREEAEAEERKRNYNPADHDDHVQAALRSMRDKTRSLCEKLQGEVDARLGHVTPKAPAWWAEYLQVLVEIEQSEHALKSVGLSTTLKPSAAQSSLFQ